MCELTNHVCCVCQKKPNYSLKKHWNISKKDEHFIFAREWEVKWMSWWERKSSLCIRVVGVFWFRFQKRIKKKKHSSKLYRYCAWLVLVLTHISATISRCCLFLEASPNTWQKTNKNKFPCVPCLKNNISKE